MIVINCRKFFQVQGLSLLSLNHLSQRSASGVVVIIPAYNEGSRIGNILSVLCEIPILDTILVIDDGSTDNTLDEIIRINTSDQRIAWLHHPKNLGKGQAVKSGLSRSAAKFVVTLDADLVGLRKEHIEDILKPVFSGEVDMASGIFRGGMWNTDFSHWATPWLSGQRCLSADLLSQISWKAANGYGLETAITIAAKRQHWRCRNIIWWGVSHPPSEGHRGILSGMHTRVKMYTHILQAWIIASQETIGDGKI